MSPSRTSAAPVVRRALLIVNPHASRAERSRVEAIEAFKALGVACDVQITEAPGHCTRIATERGAAYDAVFTLGGDGTAIEAIMGLAERGPPVAILPGGTGNVLVRTFRIPLDVRRAVPVLVRGVEKRLDLGRLGDGRCFAIGAGVGLDAAMVEGASPDMKRVVGVGAYVISSTLALARLAPFHVRLTVDGNVHERETASLLIANLGSVLGGVFTLGEGIVPDDGLLNACLFSPRSKLHAVGMFTDMLRGTAHRNPGMEYFAGKQFRVETDPALRAEADGELLGLTPLDVTVRPLAARLLVPAQ